MKFNHVGISVTDLDRSMAFYREMFGMEPLGDPFPFSGPQFCEIMDIPEVQGRMCMIASGNLWLELFEFADSKPKDPAYPVSDRGISHFGLTVDDVQATFDKLKAQGILVKNVSKLHPLLNNCLRLTVGTESENNQLLLALKDAL